jgi:hypothetical protein
LAVKECPGCGSYGFPRLDDCEDCTNAIDWMMAQEAKARAAPPPEPPLPWLALDLERASNEVEFWLYYDAKSAAQIATLTAQLAEARGLLRRAIGELAFVQPQPAPDTVRVKWVWSYDKDNDPVLLLKANKTPLLAEINHTSLGFWLKGIGLDWRENYSTLEAAKAAAEAAMREFRYRALKGEDCRWADVGAGTDGPPRMGV